MFFQRCKLLSLFFVCSFVMASEVGHASSGLVEIVDFWHLIGAALFGEHGEYSASLLSSIGFLAIVTFLGIASGLRKLKPEQMTDEQLLPPKRFGIQAFFELCWGVVSSTLESILGEKQWQRFAPLLGGTFLVILNNNLFGLLPGFHPPTTTLNYTLAMALVIFVSFVYAGIKDGGVHFFKHMAGPVLFLAPLIFAIEFIGMLARPLSLSLRLFGNVSGDHLVFQVFSSLVRDAHIPFLPVPAALMAFGTLVACLQAFIFMTLSAVYVKLAIETADHH